MFTACKLIMETGMFAAAARSATDGPGSGSGGVGDEPCVARCRVGELSSEGACEGSDHEGGNRERLGDGLFMTGVWNFIS